MKPLAQQQREGDQAGSPGSSRAFQIVSDHRHGLMESSLIRQPRIEDKCVSPLSSVSGLKYYLLSTRSNKEHVIVSCIVWLFVVVGFHWMQYLWIIPFFFWKRWSHLNNFFLGEGGGGEEECKCSAAYPAGSQLYQQDTVPGARADALLPTK